MALPVLLDTIEINFIIIIIYYYYLNSLGNIQATRMPLSTVNLLGMHIIHPLTINASTHFTYAQRDGGLSQPPARLSWEWVLNLGLVA